MYVMKKGLGEEKYEPDCSETAADADHTAYTIHVARTRYYIIITIKYIVCIYIYLYMCIILYTRCGKMNIIKAWCPSQLCGGLDGDVHTPISEK